MKWKIFTSALLLLFVFTGCKKEDPYLDVTELSLIVDDTGISRTITFTTNQEWSATSSKDWCEISPASGSEGQITMTITCKANDTYDGRKCFVTITTGLLMKMVSVSQEPNLAIIASMNNFNLNYQKQTIKLDVQSNVPYTIDISQDWIHQVTTKALSDSTFVLEVDQNASLQDRDAVISLSYPDISETVTIPLHQSALPTPNFINSRIYGVYYHNDSKKEIKYTRFSDQISMYTFNDSYSFKILNYKTSKYCSFSLDKGQFEVGELLPLISEENHSNSNTQIVYYNVYVLQKDGDIVWLYDIDKKTGFIIKQQ